VGGGAYLMELPGTRAVGRSCSAYAPARAVSGGLVVVGRRSHPGPLRLPELIVAGRAGMPPEGASRPDFVSAIATAAGTGRSNS